jgi:hypothetical protein
MDYCDGFPGRIAGVNKTFNDAMSGGVAGPQDPGLELARDVCATFFHVAASRSLDKETSNKVSGQSPTTDDRFGIGGMSS